MGACGSKNATETNEPLSNNRTFEEEPELSRKESLVRPIVQTRNEYVYNSFSVGYKELGVGLNGAVRAVQDKATGISYALKSIRKRGLDESQINDVKMEIEIMKQLDHPNIVKLIETFEDKNNIYLVMEMCTGGEVHDKLCKDGVYSHSKAANLIRKVVSALAYLHSKDIAHRDIKLANLVYENESEDANVKLIDFGLSRKFCTQEQHELMNTFVGTPSYMAPEVADCTIEYNAACDMWSVGVAAYLLMCGKYPHAENESPFHRRDQIQKYKVQIKFPSHVHPDAKDWIKKLLVKEPARRMTAAEALKHKWLKLGVQSSTSAVPKGVVDSLVHFAKQSAFKRVALMMIAHRMDSSALQEARSVFLSVDTGQTGRISLPELKSALAAAEMSDADIEFIFQALDQDSSGRIQYSEFIAAAIARREISEEDAKDVFHRLDLDNTGVISVDNLSHFIGDESLVAEAMRVASVPSGKIDLQTFTALMLDRELSITKQSRSCLLTVPDDDVNAKAPVETETISAAASASSTT